MPLQIPDPQHELGNRRCARVDLDTEEIFGRDGVAAQLCHGLLFTIGFELGQPPDHLALQLLHPRERDVKEIAGAAGRIANFGLRQLRSEEHTSELQSLMRTPYAVFRLNNKKY